MKPELTEYNQVAYDSAMTMLRASGRAIVIQPAGTDKRSIGLKLAEEHPDDRVLWLSNSEAHVDGVSNIRSLTYSNLKLMIEDELAELRPDRIVLDEYDLCDSECRSSAIPALLSVYPNCPVLGLSDVKVFDKQDIFGENITSEMTVGEAMVRGMFPKPKYVTAFYDYAEGLERCEKKLASMYNSENKNEAKAKLANLRKFIGNTDGVDKILERQITDRTGKFVVICPAEKVREFKTQIKQWLSPIDTDPHIYTVYSENDGAAEAFMADNSGHIKLLFCSNESNLNIKNISGVIFFRDKVAPYEYKRQLGHALSICADDAVIFDFVNSFRNIYSIDAIKNEIKAARNRCRTDIDFSFIDEAEEVVKLMSDLGSMLSVSWDEYCDRSRQYLEEYGDILVPAEYKTADGVALGQWIVMERMIRRGVVKGRLTDEQIARLDALGMRWEKLNDARWDTFYRHALEYHKEHGNLNVKLKYRSPDGYLLGEAVCNLRKSRKKGEGVMLNDERITLLDKLGMRWGSRTSWEYCFPAAEKYYAEHGNLKVPTSHVDSDGVRLHNWFESIRNGTVELTDEQREKLAEMGFSCRRFTKKSEAIEEKPRRAEEIRWDRNFELAREYYETNGNLKVPAQYKTEDGDFLGQWIRLQRRKKADGTLDPEREQRLNSIGMVWQNGEAAQWERTFECARKYYEEHGNLIVPAGYRTDDSMILSDWLKRQRQRLNDGTLEPERAEKLAGIGLRRSAEEARWEKNFELARKYYEEHGNLNISTLYKTGDGTALGLWLRRQRQKLRDGTLEPERAERLLGIGLMEKAVQNVRSNKKYEDRQWNRNFENARKYYETHKDLDVPSKYKADDGTSLGQWLRYQSRKRIDGTLTSEKIQKLDSIGMVWRIPESVVWDKNFEIVRKYFETNKNLNIPDRYKAEDGSALSQWLTFQKKKLSDGTLVPEQVEELAGIGLTPDKPQIHRSSRSMDEKRWEKNFEYARRYYDTHKNLDIPSSYKVEDGSDLGQWLTRQRNKLNEGTLDPKRAKKLAGIGLAADIPKLSKAERWEKNFELAREYYEANRNLNVSDKYKTENGVALGRWIEYQRRKRAEGELELDMVEKLNSIGMVWSDAGDARWNKNFEYARKYYEANKNLNIPGHYMAEDGSDLGQWLSRQRKKLNDGTLSSERVEKLASIGLMAEKAQKPKPHEGKRPKQRQSGIEPVSVGWNRP